MTPIEQAIFEIEQQINRLQESIDKTRNINPKNVDFIRLCVNVQSGYRGSLSILQSFLPVEQKYNCDFAEWCSIKGWHVFEIGSDYTKWNNSITHRQAYSTELLQLFNDKTNTDGL